MASSRNINGLTAKQQVFCDLFRSSEDPEIQGNAKACYKIAYGANDKSAEANGPRLLKDKHVSTYLEMKRTQAEEAADITEARILKEIACSAFLDPADFYDENGRLLHIQSMPEHARRALAGMEVYVEFEGKGEEREAVGQTHKIKYCDKKAHLELLMKNKGMLKEKVEHSGNVGGVLLIPGDVSDPNEWLKQYYNNKTPQT